MTDVESMDYTHSHLPSLLASSVPCIALSHLESWCKLCTSILHHAFISIFIALWAVITHYVTILMPILSYFTRFT